MVRIQVAVYTAFHGYAWSSIPDGVTEGELKALADEISNVCPERLGDGDRFEGVLYDGKYIVAFLALRLSNWDANNRPARYFALAFVPRESGASVDFDELLKCDFFQAATHSPDCEMVYVGERSKCVPKELLERVFSETNRPVRLDFSLCGDLLQHHGINGTKWKFVRTNMTGWTGTEFDFEVKRKSVFDTEVPAKATGGQERETPLPTISLDGSSNPNYKLRNELIALFRRELQDQASEQSKLIGYLREKILHLQYAVYALVAMTVFLLVRLFFWGQLIPFADSHPAIESSEETVGDGHGASQMEKRGNAQPQDGVGKGGREKKKSNRRGQSRLNSVDGK